MLIRSFPLFAVVALFYNAILFTNPDWFAMVLFEKQLQSGAYFELYGEHVILMISIAVLYIEIIKATMNPTTSVLDHLLSVGVFTLCLIEFFVIAEAGTATFLLIVILTLFDVVAGFTVTIATARKTMRFD